MYTEMAEAFFKKSCFTLVRSDTEFKVLHFNSTFSSSSQGFASGKYGGGVFGATAAAAAGGKEDKRVLEMDLLLVMLCRYVGN